MTSKPRRRLYSRPAREHTHQQPFRIVVSRRRQHGVTLALLDCGHEEPATGKDLHTEVQCRECPPERVKERS